MECKNCGTKLKENEYICPECGSYNVNEENWEEGAIETSIKIVKEPPKKAEKPVKNKKQEFQIKDSSGTRKNEFYYENEDLLEAYIGEDYKLIKKSPFNIWAFLFNWVYLLYRKLYITGIIGLIISWLVILFLRRYIWIYVGITAIVLGLSFSQYYIMIAKRRVEKIKREAQQEGNDDKFTVTNLCRENGGVNVTKALLIYSVFLVVIFLFIIRINININHNTKFWNENSENLANCTTVVKSVYQNMKSKKELGALKEAICKVIKQNSKEYEIYIKSEAASGKIYSYYKTENGSLYLQNTTTYLADLQSQKASGTISMQDEQLLSELELISAKYQKYYNQSKEEDKLIKSKKNKEEKLCYILTKEEIIR